VVKCGLLARQNAWDTKEFRNAERNAPIFAIAA
jgi:hypothetical protein